MESAAQEELHNHNASEESPHDTTTALDPVVVSPPGSPSNDFVRLRTSGGSLGGREEDGGPAAVPPHGQDDVLEDFPDEVDSVRRRRRSTATNWSDEGTQQTCDKQMWLALTLRGSGMIGMTFLNPACSVLAMNYASPSILAPFSGLTLVWIVLFSQPLIGESPTLHQVSAAALIVLGEAIVAAFGDHTNDEGVSVEDVRQSYRYPPFILYFVGLGIWMATLVYWMHRPQGGGDSNRDEKYDKLKRFSWGVAGGSVTGLQNFLKDSLTILKAVRADQANASLPWYLIIMVLLAAGSAFGGLLFLTACMKRYDATYSSAMFVGSFVVSASLMSAVHYATFSHLETFWSWILYPLGIVILMAGVWMLVNEHHQRSNVDPPASRREGPVEMVSLQEVLVHFYICRNS